MGYLPHIPHIPHIIPTHSLTSSPHIPTSSHTSPHHPTHPSHHPHTSLTSSPHIPSHHPHTFPHIIPAHPHIIPHIPHIIPCIISSTSRTEFSLLEFSWIISCSADCHPGEGDLCSALLMLSDESFKNLRIEVQHACNLFASGEIFLSECSCQLESRTDRQLTDVRFAELLKA